MTTLPVGQALADTPSAWYSPRTLGASHMTVLRPGPPQPRGTGLSRSPRRHGSTPNRRRLDAEQKKERDNAAEERLRALSERGRTRRKGPSTKHTASPTKNGSGTAASTTKLRPSRLLVNPDELELRNDDGELVGGVGPGGGIRKSRKAKSNGKPRDPDMARSKPSTTGGRDPQNYTDDERQGVGLNLLRRVLGGDEEEIVDIRHQHNVGADAVDQLKNLSSRCTAAPFRMRCR